MHLDSNAIPGCFPTASMQLKAATFAAATLEQHDAKLAPVIGRERQLRDRNDQMRVPNKSFKDVLSIIKIAQDQHAARQKQASKAPPPPPQQVIPICYNLHRAPGGFERLNKPARKFSNTM